MDCLSKTMSEPLPRNCSANIVQAAPTQACRPLPKGSTSTAPLSIGTTPRSPARCSTAPQTNTPEPQSGDLLATMTPHPIKPSGASAAKTATCDVTSKSMKNTSADSPLKTADTKTNSKDWLGSLI